MMKKIKSSWGILESQIKGKSGVIDGPHAGLNGARVTVIKRSQRTGGLTVEFLEDRRPYKTGDYLHLPRHEFKMDPEVSAPKAERVFTDGVHGHLDYADAQIEDAEDGRYWCHCPQCDTRTACDLVATQSDRDWAKFGCSVCTTEFNYPTRHAQPVTKDAKPEKRFVLCTNDFPYRVLPPGTTIEEAYEVARRLNVTDEKWCERPVNGGQRRVHYHTHECEVESLNSIELWGDRK